MQIEIEYRCSPDAFGAKDVDGLLDAVPFGVTPIIVCSSRSVARHLHDRLTLMECNGAMFFRGVLVAIGPKPSGAREPSSAEYTEWVAVCDEWDLPEADYRPYHPNWHFKSKLLAQK